MARKYDPLNVVQMFATLTLEHWKSCLVKATKSNNIEKLMAWRYGLQSGLADAVAKGHKSEKLDLWVIKRCSDLEKCMRFILKKKHNHLIGDPKKDATGYIRRAIEAKRKRDRDFETFLMKSNF